jgi:hypothetical protein
MDGYREPSTHLWRLQLNHNEPSIDQLIQSAQHTDGHAHHVNALLPEGAAANVIQFLHKALFSPSKFTLLKAINNNNQLTTWPGMTTENVTKHLQKSFATTLGHQDQTRKNARSTQPQPPIDEKSEQEPDPISPQQRTHQVFTAIVDSGTGKIYTDQTGRFPVTSSRGNKYLFLLYDYDSNDILAEPIKSRQQDELLRAYKQLIQHLQQRGLTPKLQRLDNECSAAMKTEMDAQNIDWQLTPVGIHRRNAAERAIHTFKNHLLAGLASTDDNFPVHLWCRLVKQAQQTPNLLRTSRINPRLSAEAQLNGQFDYNRTPLAPPGIKVVIHERHDTRKS